MLISKDEACLSSKPYRGRFAPSPTGPLHAGSLLAAMASFLEARKQGGHWLLRIEDLDPPREQEGAASGILNTLEAFGFEWNGPVVYQSHRHDRYREVLEQLRGQDKIYPCACTRREIMDSSVRGIEGAIYPGTCRNGLSPGRQARAWRMRCEEAPIGFEDAILGRQSQSIAQQIGDFVLLRADGLFAYQLAVVVDDAEQGISHIVRGADLLDSTARQIYLQKVLQYITPNYAHIPVLSNAQGEKLSKQTLAASLVVAHAPQLLYQGLQRLGQCPPAELSTCSQAQIWAWALQNWDMDRVLRQKQIVDAR